MRLPAALDSCLGFGRAGFRAAAEPFDFLAYPIGQ